MGNRRGTEWAKAAGAIVTIILAVIGLVWSYSGHEYRIKQLEIAVASEIDLFAKKDLVEQKFDMVSYQIADVEKHVVQLQGSIESSIRELFRSVNSLLVDKQLSDREGKKK